MGRGRGVSCGGGRSSLGYLFGSENENNNINNNNNSTSSSASNKSSPTKTEDKINISPIKKDVIDQSTKTTSGRLKNNYYRSDGQNCGNFITDRPTTKVHAAPGGRSSLGYLFGDQGKN
ncbi:Protein SPIRAL1-like 1 [Linum perenne]